MTKEELEGYLAEGLSLEQIGKRSGREKSTISYHLKRHSLKPVGVKYANKGALPKNLLDAMVDEQVSLSEMRWTVVTTVARSSSSGQWLVQMHEMSPGGRGSL